MSPSAEERLSALENEKEHDKSFQKEVRDTLKCLPGRIARLTQKQIEACQQSKNVQCMLLAKAAEADAKAKADPGFLSKVLDSIDPKNVVKLFFICVIVGGLVSGFVYQELNPNIPVVSLINHVPIDKKP